MFGIREILTVFIKFILFSSLFKNVHPGAVQMSNSNFDSIMGGNELVFVNFYANWCRFSQMLEPIFDEFATKLAKEIQPGKVMAAKVDCDTETELSTKNHINKYPTLKLFRFGIPIKKEYRGARTADAFLQFIKDQIADPIKVVNNYGDYHNIENKKATIIGYFDTTDAADYKVFQKLSSMLRDSCSFYAAVGPAFANKRLNGDSIVFRSLGSHEQDDNVYTGGISQYDTLYAWANEKCTPLVREITFENAEELTEEGLPFVILFHRPEDLESVKLFEREVQRQLVHEKNSVNAVHADGLKFSHPLHHLGKSVADLPLLAIDSFRHMYLFSDFKKLAEGEHLLQFVKDLHSGKLHREFHNGPDPTTEAPKKQDIQISMDQGHIPKVSNNDGSEVAKQSTPPESVFIKLAPSPERYSIKHEL